MFFTLFEIVVPGCHGQWKFRVATKGTAQNAVVVLQEWLANETRKARDLFFPTMSEDTLVTHIQGMKRSSHTWRVTEVGHRGESDEPPVTQI